jgi:hypothetical protein
MIEFISKIINNKPEQWKTSPDYRYSYQEKLHFLRTAVYWQIAGQLTIPFLPDFTRIPIIAWYRARLGKRLYKSISMVLQSYVDNNPKNRPEYWLPIPTPILIPFPCALSKFLNKYQNSSLEETLDSMREEFKDRKRAITEWETSIRNAGTDFEIQEIMDISQSIAATVQKENFSEIVLSVSNPVAEDAITAMTAGTPGTTTAKAAPGLIKSAAGIVRRHFRRKKN